MGEQRARNNQDTSEEQDEAWDLLYPVSRFINNNCEDNLESTRVETEMGQWNGLESPVMNP